VPTREMPINNTVAASITTLEKVEHQVQFLSYSNYALEVQNP
jgi:hypothetical protein